MSSQAEGGAVQIRAITLPITAGLDFDVLVTSGFNLSGGTTIAIASVASALGAIFIMLVQNGTNLVQVSSTCRRSLLGRLLILAVIADRIRTRMMLGAN